MFYYRKEDLIPTWILAGDLQNGNIRTLKNIDTVHRKKLKRKHVWTENMGSETSMLGLRTWALKHPCWD